MDKFIRKIAALGVPGLVLLLTINATGYAGAAALTAALSAIGPGGMLGGIACLGISVVVVDAIAKYGFEAIYKGVIKQLYAQGETKETIRSRIEKYPVSNDLKRNLSEWIETLSGNE